LENKLAEAKKVVRGEEGKLADLNSKVVSKTARSRRCVGWRGVG
jgi:hypothetical protein